MSVLEEVQRMLRAGKSEQELSETLQASGIPIAQINEALVQAKIKQAVDNPLARQPGEQEYDQVGYSGNEPSQYSQTIDGQPPQYAGYADNAPSSQEQPQEGVGYPMPYPGEVQYPPQQSEQQGQYPQYPQYAPQEQDNAGSDVFSEIADQILSEKLSPLSTKLNIALDARAILETKMESLDERLKRIEKTIDRLQLSVLQKVGDYVNNVEDIKKELVETQKTFKAVHHKHSSK